MARPYKKRVKQVADFKICDLNAMKEKCLCSIDNICVCAKLKGICKSDSSANASIALGMDQLSPVQTNGQTVNGFQSPGK